jgi:hypothetical protein
MYSDMDTGIFEPLAGLNDTDYMIEIQPSRNISEILNLAIEMGNKIERFYQDLAAQLKSRRGGVARSLVKMVQENSEPTLKLRKLEESV